MKIFCWKVKFGMDVVLVFFVRKVCFGDGYFQ